MPSVITIGKYDFRIDSSILETSQLNISCWGRTFSLIDEKNKVRQVTFNEILKSIHNSKTSFTSDEKKKIMDFFKKIRACGISPRAKEWC